MTTPQDNKLNPPLFIGTEFYHTVDELLRDFNLPKLPLELKTLKEYFEVGRDPPEKDPKKEAPIKSLLEKRINVLEDNRRLEINNSLNANRKRMVIEKLNDIIKDFDAPKEAEVPTRPLKKADILYQLYKIMWLLSNIHPDDPNGIIDVGDQWDSIMQYLEKIAPDEVMQKVGELETKKVKLQEKLAKKNELIKFVNSNSAAAPTSSTSGADICKIENTAKRNIIKLFTLFKTQKILTDTDLSTMEPEELNKLLNEVLSQEDPTIARNIRLAYRSIIRFYRDQYLRVMKHMQTFLNKYYNPKTSTINFPIDPLVRVVYIMNELERFVYKEGLTGTSKQFNFFPTNEGLIRLLGDGREREYNTIVDLVNHYKAYTTTLGLKNNVDPATSKDDINYQLINMHTSPGPRKGILQLLCGSDINYDQTVVASKITDLTEQLGTRQNFETLRDLFDTFFDKKDTSLYIIYQNAPIDLLKKKEVKIKQLDELECLVTNVHSLQLNNDAMPLVEQPTPTEGYNILQLLSADKLKPPKIKNTFSQFGITIKNKPYQLVQSITQLTGSLLNATYIDEATYYRKQKDKPSASVDGTARV